MKKTISMFRLGALALASTMALGSVSAIAAEVDGPAVNWKLSTWGKQRAFTAGVEEMAKQLSAKTGGKFKLKVFYGGALSKAKENLDGMKLNAFEMAMFCNFYHPGKNPANMVFTMPFVDLGDPRVSLDVRAAMYQHPALQNEMKQWNAMLYVSTLLPQYEFLGKGEPPRTPSDFKGMRVRAGGGVAMAMEKMGATKTTVPATEVYTGMERGTFDAASFPFTYAHAAYKVHEVADWYTANMSPGTSECPVVINQSAYDKLPAQYQKLIMDLKPAINKAQVAAYANIDKKNLPMFEKKMKRVVFAEAQLDDFRAVAGKPVWDQWVAENKDKFDAQDVLDTMMAEVKKAKAKYGLQ